ncbi:MAG: hypothetical protein IJZ08_00815 [Clostridia bacterium]|nr:hypothetical protein [Clostridia bacterium]
MKKNYMVNTDTGTLHIVGFCSHTTKTRPVHIKYFDTEEDAYLELGRKVKPCNVCQTEKEKRLEKSK